MSFNSLRRQDARFPSACNCGTMVCGKGKFGTKEKARTCADWQGHSDRRALASRRARRDRCLDRVIKRQNAYSGTRYQAVGGARTEGEREITAFLRTVLYRFCLFIALACGIAALTITAAIVTNKLQDSQAWMSVMFFVAVGVAAWIAGRTASIRSPPPAARNADSEN
jgi:hypothetical protein